VIPPRDAGILCADCVAPIVQSTLTDAAFDLTEAILRVLVKPAATLKWHTKLRVIAAEVSAHRRLNVCLYDWLSMADWTVIVITLSGFDGPAAASETASGCEPLERSETIDEGGDAGCAEAVVDVNHADVGRAGVQHAQ
jgi:hypothetical protein